MLRRGRLKQTSAERANRPCSREHMPVSVDNALGRPEITNRNGRELFGNETPLPPDCGVGVWFLPHHNHRLNANSNSY